MKLYKTWQNVIMDGLDTHVTNQIKNKYDFAFWKKLNPELASLVERNERFRGIHKGERCFILANGPSLKETDLSYLKGEILFGVNLCGEAFYNAGIPLSFYLSLDGIFFQGYIEDRNHMIQNLRYIEKMGNVACFFPIECRDFLRGHRFDRKLDVNYLGPVRLSMEKLVASEVNPCELTRFRYLSYSIAIDAVMAAIYMGFTEIYLLGCDASVIKSRIDVFMGNAAGNVHFYGNDGKSFETQMRRRGILQELRTEHYCFQNWNYINQYCMKHGIKLINLSSSTLLDFIPRKSYEKQLQELGIG
ncbi:MAG: hypothetical protein HDR02_12930 [Lachnospiraceae bacterium]|nr:hypothetical protein [Lachnospiraceae bacterium]